jgi:SAM-dependent methyltransferase
VRGSRSVSLRRLDELLSFHRSLLADGVRNRAFEGALERYVEPKSRVLDIGSGTGVWAILAARLGAREVVAVEKEPLLIPIVRQLVRDNGVQDRVRVVLGDSRRLRLRREYDVVVSETLGNAAYDEQIVPILADAHRRFLKPGGVTIPSAVAFVAAPARVELPQPSVPLRWGLLHSLWSCFAHVDSHARIRTLGPPRSLLRTRLGSTMVAPSRRNLSATWALADTRKLNAVALWVEAELAPGLLLRTRARTHWNPILLPVEPFACRRAEVRLRLTFTGLKSRWEVTANAARGRTDVRVASPLFAYGWLKPRLSGERVVEEVVCPTDR